VDELRQREEDAQNLLQEAQAVTAKRAAFRVEAGHLAEELEKILGILPPEADADREIAWLRETAARTGLEIGKPEALPVRHKEFYSELPVVFEVEATREEVAELAALIERRIPLHRVSRVGVPWGQPGRGRCFLEVVAFYMPP
jgi:Tfp pilus assembly protein PilO